MSDTTTLYRLFDSAGDLLYVGISLNFGQRFVDHGRDKPWWQDVARAELEHLPTRIDALAAERCAIQLERPTHNVVHNCVPKIRRDVGTQTIEATEDMMMLAAAHQDVMSAIDTRNRIAASLLDQGFTSRRLAEVAGVTHQTVRNWAEAAR